MTWWDDFVEGIKKALSWLGSDKTRQDVLAIMNLALMILRVADKFNDPLTPREKDIKSRTIMDFFRYADDEDIQVMIETREKTNLKGLRAFEIDAVLGMAKAKHVGFKRDDAENLPGEIKDY